ncbi:DUF2235 domain-containing protein [Pseudomonas sp. Pseusp122]|uniref:T6SS phospholipase effector Tle1-like catalytic domain-containing protein n=1 Tax=unclassified Pseudomonas TaxID=196821 RepID=UPI0039A43CDB
MKSTRKVQAAGHSPASVTSDVIVRIGLFFDGTGNNRVNSRIGADCRAMAEVNEYEHSVECRGCRDNPFSSYAAALSNIARLFELYPHQLKASREADQLRAYWAIYISGVGTTTKGGDSLWPGQSFGRGSTGVVAKAEQAIRKIGRCLEAFGTHNPDCRIARLELDLFGFSRGAASARHFANEVLKQGKGALDPLFSRYASAFSPDFAWGNDSVLLKVIGLFDTVAAVAGLLDMGNVRDAANRKVNLYLPPGCAQQVLHLVARDEQRRNFALNSIAPQWPREILLPGAHSDIGGGYHPQVREKVLVTRPRRCLVSCGTPWESTPAWAEAQADLQALDAGHWLDPEDPLASLQVECAEERANTVHGRCSLGLKSVVAAVCLRRQVFGHLSLVSLRVMHALACDEGVPFAPIGSRPELQLLPELFDINAKLIRYARGADYELDAGEELMLRHRYIHRSAHWRSLIGHSGRLGQMWFVHAPQPGGRILHPNQI